MGHHVRTNEDELMASSSLSILLLSSCSSSSLRSNGPSDGMSQSSGVCQPLILKELLSCVQFAWYNTCFGSQRGTQRWVAQAKFNRCFRGGIKVIMLLHLIYLMGWLLAGFGRILAIIHFWIILGCICSHISFNILLYFEVIVHHKDRLLLATIL